MELNYPDSQNPYEYLRTTSRKRPKITVTSSERIQESWETPYEYTIRTVKTSLWDIPSFIVHPIYIEQWR